MAEFTTIIEDGFGFVKNPEKGGSDLIRRYTLTNRNNVQVQVISYGATITSVKCPDKKGRIHDVVLGFDDIQGYIRHQRAYFGSTIGRVANRVANGRFKLGTQEYELSRNAGEFQLHGGFKGFDQRVWESYVDGTKVVFTYISQDGEEGYPGDLMTQVAYSLLDDNGLKLEMTAMTNKPTPVNLTNHVYFNLAGHCAGPKTLFDHYATINADKMLVTTPELIPTGEIRRVGGTIYDLRVPRHLGTVIPEVPGGGYDNTMCINGTKDDGVRFVARVFHPPSGRVVEVFSNQPALQWYTSRNLPIPDAPLSSEEQLQQVPDIKTPPSEPLMGVGSSKLHSREQSHTGSRPSSQPGFKSPLQTSSQNVFGSTPVISQEVYGSIPPSKSEFQEVYGSVPPSQIASQQVSGSAPPSQTASAQQSRVPSVQHGEPIDLEGPKEEPSQPIIPGQMIGKDGTLYKQYGAFCLETQNYPDAVNHTRFPNSILIPGEIYRHTCIYRFLVQK